MKITKAINLDDAKLSEKTRKETKRFIEKFKYNWSTDVKKRARHVLRERKLNATVELPDPKDIARLATYMKQKMEEAQQPRTIDEFWELQYDTLARLIAYNRRRPGEDTALGEKTRKDIKRFMELFSARKSLMVSDIAVQSARARDKALVSLQCEYPDEFSDRCYN